eukprot:CAMPEP_0119011770 /NCGR_PEP_ID=MMETSP1176-20130426/5879_1 /TAXON_ID=265551 /ORGANISM="Synedropsis recta cf, Strain CCMP1620" /LENGTH=229 /DNA_ID=CAMNT_0006964633 /DNA_START=45 /DNA_END=731 /DNA_ORIENTATION=+
MASTNAGLNLSGKLFFGGLSVGTFYLGCWQTQRYSQKISLMEERMKELALDPQEFDAKDHGASFRRQLVRGQYIHDGEMLVGPRGPPPGALAVTGPASGRSEGGMSSGPQGYYVITPFESSVGRTLLVNRGWIPRNFLEGGMPFDRPSGTVQIVGVPGKGEQPRFMVPQHDFSKRPLRFYWFDKDVMEDMAGLEKGDAQLMIQVEDAAGTRAASQYPAQPPPGAVGEYK